MYKTTSYTPVNSNHLQVARVAYGYFTLLLQIMKKPDSHPVGS
jgi:hypothetical protein